MYKEKEVKARKEHKCVFCSELINKGEKCKKCCGVMNNDFYSYYLCNRCEKYINKHKEISDSIRVDGLDKGDYWDWKRNFGD